MKSLRRFLFSKKSAAMVFWVLCVTTVTAVALSGTPGAKTLGKVNAPSGAAIQSSKMIDVNNLAMWVQNNGLFANDPETGQSGLYYPTRKNIPPSTDHTLIYTSGLLIGAMVGDSLRTMVSVWEPDASPGAMDHQGMPFGRDDSAFRVYKIGTQAGLMQSEDYRQWPINQGAPLGLDGKPLLLGDQTLWCCFTDGYAYPIGHSNSRTQPLGAEVHMTVYGWSCLDNILFLKWEIINKGQYHWKDAYVGVFADCELGGAGDDLVGSDSSLALVYDYNADDNDESYKADIPAVGYAFLQTPIVASAGHAAFLGNRAKSGFRNLPAKAPVYYKHPPSPYYSGWGEFYTMSLKGAGQIYRRLQGLNDQSQPMINPVTGRRTDWGLSGDPVAITGWLDLNAQDRRFLLSSGPFNMAPGDTQQMAIAIVVGHGRDRLDSITELRKVSASAHGIFRADGTLAMDTYIADPAVRSVEIPIRLLNPNSSLAKLEFDLAYDSTLMSILSIKKTSRSSKFDLQWINQSPGKIHIALDGLGTQSLIGIGEILTLVGELNRDVRQGSYEMSFSRLDAAKVTGEKATLEAAVGKIIVDYIPANVSLSAPEDGYHIENLDQLTHLRFQWTRSRDLDADSLTYHFYWIGEVYPFFTTADTSFFFNGTRELLPGSTNRWTVAVSDGKIVQASPDTFSLQVADLRRVREVSSVELPPGNAGMWLTMEKETLYVLARQHTGNKYEHAIHVYHLTEPMRPQLSGVFNFPENFRSIPVITAKEGIAYCVGEEITDSQDKLLVIDLRNPTAYKLVKTVGLPLDFSKMLIHKNQLFIFYQVPYPQMHWYDLTNPLAPSYKGQSRLPFDVNVNNVALRDGFLYRAGGYPDGGYAFSTYALDHSMQVADSSRIFFPNWIKSFTLDETHAYVITFDEKKHWSDQLADKLCVFDLTDPLMPNLQSSLPILPGGYGIEIIEPGYLVTADDANLDIYDVRNPENPVPIGFYLGTSSIVGVRGPWIYSQWHGQLKTLFAEILPGVGDTETPDSGFRLFQNYPNPFNASTTISYALYQPGRVEIAVYNILGEQVSTIENRSLDMGYYTTQWDGKQGNGIPCAAGLYFCRVKAGEQVQIKKMVKLP